MPRVSKKAKQDEGLAFLAEFAGLDLVNLQQKVAEAAPAQEAEISMLQAEGVLLHIYNLSRTMLTKRCKECGEVFSTRYRAVAYCSNLCRRTAMRKIGIAWNPSTDHYANMDAERPIVLTPEVHQVVVQAAQRIVEDRNLVVHLPEEPTTHLEVPQSYDVDVALDGPYLDGPQTTPEISPPLLDSLELPDLDFPSPF